MVNKPYIHRATSFSKCEISSQLTRSICETIYESLIRSKSNDVYEKYKFYFILSGSAEVDCTLQVCGAAGSNPG